ncbi:MAG: Riboflavin biosynthesis protein RibF, partial [Candidatus Kaiserbacteria bacterium GW2011_GWC2_49_12]
KELVLKTSARKGLWVRVPPPPHMQKYIGIVHEGAKRAAALGFPTVNISLEDTSLSGVYAACVKVGNNEHVAAAFADPERGILEAYLLDFSPRTLYGETITIELYERIRRSMKFETDKARRSAIADDVAKVREYFKKRA